MSEIKKYRGKRVDNDEWVYGFHFTTPLTVENFGIGCLNDGIKRHCISDYQGVVYEVIPETVGCFTGKYDIHEKEAYEGDLITELHIVDSVWEEATIIEPPMGIVKWVDFYWNVCQLKKGVVKFYKDDDSLIFKCGDLWDINISTYDGLFTEWNGKFEVVGNIHDDQQLLKTE